jgi:glycosyltransferase involved in cell wall biosynthesis
MKILFVGPHPLKGGGVAYYQQALAASFYKKKNEVVTLSLVTDFGAKKSFLKEAGNPDFRYAKVYELVSNKLYYFRSPDPVLDCESLEEEQIFREFLKEKSPDVIHFHAARPASTIKISKELGIPVIVSLHDYWFICNTGFLCRWDNQVCEGPKDGINCAEHCDVCQIPFLRFKEKLRRFLPPSLIRILKHLKNKGSFLIVSQPAYLNNLLNISKTKDVYPSGELRPTNLERWSQRINYMREMLNQYTDLIISVSNEAAEIFIENGISSDKIKVVHSGFEHTDKFFSFKKRKRDHINFAYIGPIWREKGLHILLNAFQKIGRDYNCSLYVYGRISMGSYGYIMKKLIKKMGMSNIVFNGEFNYDDLPSIYENIDIQIIPPIIPDTSPRTIWEALSSGTPPIASNIGGIPDFVKDEVNGLLFESGNSDDLAQKMKRILDDQNLIQKLRRGIKRLKTIEEHSLELITIYENAISENEAQKGVIQLTH